MGLIFAMSILGLILGRTMIGRLNQEAVVNILSWLLMFLSFIYSIGIHNLLKYYYIKRLALPTEDER